MSKIYLEILDKKRQAIFSRLSVFKNSGYLAGGTALALQINHRKSVDFDVFVEKPITGYLRKKINKVFGKQEFYINTSDQISFKTKGEIGVTFVWYYYPLLYPSIKTHFLNLASVDDIATDKAETIGRRAVWRDYVDIFFLLKKNIITLEKIMKLAKRKFQGEFVETQFLQQLPYFTDLIVTPMEYINKQYNEQEIKSFLEKQVEGYLKKRLKI